MLTAANQKLDTYTPSDTILKWSKVTGEGAMDNLKGLSSVVADAVKLGYRPVIDFGENDWEEINAKNVRLACHEVDVAQVGFLNAKGFPAAWILVVPLNGGPDEWLADYTVTRWLEALIENHIYS